MPELPEVETVVRQLARPLPGLRIREVTVLHADLLVEPPDAFREGLLGSVFLDVSRRGKNIVLGLHPARCLVVNLGMTGKLLFHPSSSDGGGRISDPPPYEALRFDLAPEGCLYYADTRRFGSLRRFNPEAWEAESRRLGPEPLDPKLTPGGLRRSLGRSRSPIRSWLLDQTRIAGIGNIYAAEALFRAGIHPSRPARTLGPGEAARLLDGIRDVLQEAIQARGTTLRDYRMPSGDPGGFGPSLLVYGREGEPCTRCNTSIRRVVFGNRSAFFCPCCQPR